MKGESAMATAVRTVQRIPSALYRHDEMLEELRREQREEFEARPRELCVSLTPTDAVDANEIEALSDSCWGGGIGTAMLDITDSTEPIVLSICGRDRRLRIR
jgi:hypothetical protein